MSKYIITGYSEFEERDTPQQIHGVLVIEGEELNIIKIVTEEVAKVIATRYVR